MTVFRLVQLASAEQTAKGPIAIKARPWRNIAQVGAIAAAIFLVVGILIPSLSFARHQYRKHACRSQLAGIGSCMTSYCADYDDKLPAVSADVRRAWHDVGYQGKENQSNS